MRSCSLRCWVATVILVAVVSMGCSKERQAIGAIQEAFDSGDYEETIVQCEHALRRDVRTGRVFYYYWRALLELDRDFESFRRFEEAVDQDSTLAGRIAQDLVVAADPREPGRLREAVRLDPTVDLGQHKFAVAGAFYSDREFDQAASLYRQAVEENPDTLIAERAFFNLSDCYLALADTAEAINMLEEQLVQFPKGQLSGQARYKLVNILYDNAQAEFYRGNYEVVVELVTSLLERTTNRTLLQRARFLLGEAYERLEDYRNAYEQYKTIIEEDRGASGRIVDRARNKINALHDAGLL